MTLNGGFSYRDEVDRDADSLVAYLATAHPHSTALDWAQRLSRGELEVSGRRVEQDVPLRAGQCVTWHRPPWEEPDVALHFQVVFEDAHLLVVDKPSGLPTLPGGGFSSHTLLALLRARDPRWSPVHRLGRGTSGLVACTRAPDVRARLQATFVAHRVDKRYLALAQGAIPMPTSPRRIDQPIGPVAHPRLGTVHAASGDGKPASTLLLSARPRGDDSVAELRLVTGRPHQIRIHLASIGHPLRGDPLYTAGGQPRGDALPGDGGYLLHAWSLRFEHPMTGQPLALEAAPPAGLE